MGGYSEMMIAANKGMFTITNNSFQPGSPLTREEMARVLAVAYDYKGSGKSSFKDLSKASPIINSSMQSQKMKLRQATRTEHSNQKLQ